MNGAGGKGDKGAGNQGQNKIANAFSVFKIKQSGKKTNAAGTEEEKQEVDEAIKRTILSLFKPGNKWIRAARNYRDNGEEVDTPEPY